MAFVKQLSFACVIVTFAGLLLSLMLAASSAQPQPQPRLELESSEWGLLEFDNGSQWYMKSSAILAIHAVPNDQAEILGHKSVVYIGSLRITTPYTAEELDERIVRGPKAKLFKNKPETPKDD